MRVVPICPELRAILADAFEQADPGATLVVPMAARKGVNVRTHLERIIKKAGHAPWPRLLQNLRASCETDWVEKYPSHVVAKWLGHSPKVAAQHYLMSREHHFEDVVRGSSPGPAPAAAVSPEAADDRGAECCARVVQNASQHASAPDRTKRQNPLQPKGLQRVLRKLRRLPETAEWRGQDSNLRPRGYEPRELPGCSTPRRCVVSAVSWPIPAEKLPGIDVSDHRMLSE